MRPASSDQAFAATRAVILPRRRYTAGAPRFANPCSSPSRPPRRTQTGGRGTRHRRSSFLAFDRWCGRTSNAEEIANPTSHWLVEHCRRGRGPHCGEDDR